MTLNLLCFYHFLVILTLFNKNVQDIKLIKSFIYKDLPWARLQIAAPIIISSISHSKNNFWQHYYTIKKIDPFPIYLFPFFLEQRKSMISQFRSPVPIIVTGTPVTFSTFAINSFTLSDNCS